MPSAHRRRALRRALNEFLRHRGYDSAAALTFFTALLVLPATLLTVSAFASVGDRGAAIDALDAVLGPFLPRDDSRAVHDALADLLKINSPGIALTIGLVLTIWSASGYVTAFGRAVDSIYEIQEGRPVWRFRAEMVVAAVPLVALGGIATGLLLVTPSVSARAAHGLGLGDGAAVAWDVLRWPLLLLVLVLMVGLLYRVGPNVRFTRISFLSAGTLLSLGVWAVLTAAFALYLALTGAYGHLYGRLGVLLAALLWAYLSNLALMIGAQLDAEVVRLRQLESGQDAVESILLPVKSTRRAHALARRRHDDVAEAIAVRDAARAQHRADAES